MSEVAAHRFRTLFREFWFTSSLPTLSVWPFHGEVQTRMSEDNARKLCQLFPCLWP